MNYLFALFLLVALLVDPRQATALFILAFSTVVVGLAVLSNRLCRLAKRIQKSAEELASLLSQLKTTLYLSTFLLAWLLSLLL